MTSDCDPLCLVLLFLPEGVLIPTKESMDGCLCVCSAAEPEHTLEDACVPPEASHKTHKPWRASRGADFRCSLRGFSTRPQRCGKVSTRASQLRGKGPSTQQHRSTVVHAQHIPSGMQVAQTTQVKEEVTPQKSCCRRRGSLLDSKGKL